MNIWINTPASTGKAFEAPGAGGRAARVLAARALAALCALAACLLVALAPSVAAASGFVPVERVLPLVVDYADLLTDEEERELEALFEQLGNEHRIEIAVVTVYSLDGKSPMDYADDFYDYNGYGYGPDDDGILLLISMEERDWWVTTHGRAYVQLTEDRFNTMMDDVLPYLSSGDYYTAFSNFGYRSAWLMQLETPGFIIDIEEERSYVTLLGALRWLGIGAIAGLASAAVRNSTQMGKHKTVYQSQGAKSYLLAAEPVVEGGPMAAEGASPNVARLIGAGLVAGAAVGLISNNDLRRALRVVGGGDHFISRNVTRVRRDSGTSSSGGRSSGGGGGFGGHVSSSGRSHGGGGGKF